MFHPKVSIIMPVYNGTNYMREAIDSALAQTYDNIEVIVINDGSKDNGATLDVAKSYKEQIRLIDKPNGGVATALNAGINRMEGEYFSWLSHDDVYPSDKVEKQVLHLSTLDNKDIIIFGDYTIIDENSRNIGKVSTSHIDTKNMLFELYAYQTIHGCTLLVPKKAFDVCGNFREDLPTTQDYDLWLRMAEKFPFSYSDGIFTHSRQHAEQGSRTSKHKNEVLQFYLKNLEKISSDYMNQKYNDTVLQEKYKTLLAKFSNVTFWPVFLRVYQQAQKDLSSTTNLNKIKFFLKSASIFYTGSIKGYLKQMIPLSIKNLLRRNLNRPPLGAAERPATLDFIKIYQNNIFGSKESRSGSGSTMRQTRYIRTVFPVFFRSLGVQSILDVPCGDFNWLKEVDLKGIQYTGGDIVPALIEQNNKKYKSDERTFKMLNIITDDLPKSDLIICRDCLVHLKFEDGLKAIQNFKKSGSKYLLTTTFTDRDKNEDLFGIWRTLNLQKPPYNFLQPLKLINEKCTEGRGGFKDKCLGLWLLDDIG